MKNLKAIILGEFEKGHLTLMPGGVVSHEPYYTLDTNIDKLKTFLESAIERAYKQGMVDSGLTQDQLNEAYKNFKNTL